ncbi:MAG: hypothetical protein E7587_04185 [Ruminococcaceae bacterium]|nr:hypothetical protein [Oscillospiraceae bacterium]
MDNLLYEPLKYYETKGRQAHRANVESFFDELKRRSGIDEQQNKMTVDKYKAKQSEADKLDKKASRYKTFRVLLIIAAVLGFILLLYGFSSSLLFSLVGAVLIAASLCLIFIKLNKLIKHFSALLSEKRAEAEEIRLEAERQMAPLNALFSDRDSYNLVEKTLPELKFNVNYSSQKEKEYIELSGISPEDNPEMSTLDIISGNFNGNPFVYEKTLKHEMGEETYHGFLTIHWTERYTDSNGRRRTRTRSQTLRASVVKPKPFYSEDTVLKYVSQGAPELSFTREGMYHDDKSEKEIEKTVRRGEKELRKKQEQALEEGKNFVEMTNTEFEVLFGALNRDHEVQFRMMFTPLAQNNMVDLMRSETGYGDDFDFYKQKRVNIIHSDHTQNWKMDASVKNYHSFDFEVIKNKFITENEEFFKSVFFDFAPLFAVPMYLDEPVRSLEPLKEYKCNYTSYEYESLANRMPPSLLSAEGSATRSIIKAGKAVKGQDGSDKVELKAYSYRAYDRIDYVPRMGGDGKMHLVPVPWVEYIPVEKSSFADIFPLEANEQKHKQFSSCCHGLAARVLDE